MTLDEARLLANINARAERLFADGYHARRVDPYTIEVINDEGTPYEVDTVFAACTCPFYTQRQGRYPCKHLLGYERLLRDQEEAAKQNGAEAEPAEVRP